MRNLFKENYVGPRGPHLNWLTEITITGTYTPGKQKSIHADRQGRGKNTCAPRNPSRKGRLAKASKWLDIRRVSFGAMKEDDKASHNAPGSMKH